MSPKLLERLSFIRHLTDNPCGMYPGDHMDTAPAQHRRLIRMGYVRQVDPHNQSHLPRVVITDAGREALDKHPEGEAPGK